VLETENTDPQAGAAGGGAGAAAVVDEDGPMSSC